MPWHRYDRQPINPGFDNFIQLCIIHALIVNFEMLLVGIWPFAIHHITNGVYAPVAIAETTIVAKSLELIWGPTTTASRLSGVLDLQMSSGDSAMMRGYQDGISSNDHQATYRIVPCDDITQDQDLLNTLRPRQNGRHFPDDILKWIILNEDVWISIKISLKFFPRVWLIISQHRFS